MNVNLGQTLDQFVADMLKTGLYQSQSEVLREGLRLLKNREDLKRLAMEEIRREIAIGSMQADRGELVDGPAVFAAIRRKSAQRKRMQQRSPTSAR
jgi:antitoxin ParD1/3/4